MSKVWREYSHSGKMSAIGYSSAACRLKWAASLTLSRPEGKSTALLCGSVCGHNAPVAASTSMGKGGASCKQYP